MKQLRGTNFVDVIIAIIVVASLSLGLLGAKGIPVCLSLLLAYAIPLVIFSLSAYYSKLGQLAMSFAFVAMSVFLLLNYWQFTVQLGTVDAPYLLYDAQSFYILSHDVYNHTYGSHSPLVPYMGYPIFLSWWLQCGVFDIVYPTIFNVFLLLCAMLFIARICYFVIENRDDAKRVSSYAMALMALIPGIMGTATLLSKEPFVIFALTACVCAMYAIRQHYKTVLYAVVLVIGLLILAYIRTTYLYVLLLFFASVWFYKVRRGDILPMVFSCCAILAAIYLGSMHSWWQDSAFVERYVSPGQNITFFCGDSQEPLQRLIGPYHLYPLWFRLVLLPVTVAVQFIIPFPFLTSESPLGQPLSMVYYHRMSYLWYLSAIPMLGYFLFYWWRKGGAKLSLLAFAAAVAYCVPAFMTAGSVSRYAFCFVPFLTIVGGFVVSRLLENREELKRLGIFALIYVIIITAALYIGAHPYVLFAFIR